MGGIATNEFGEVQKTSNEVVPGLFAVGECACASFHGFNRLGTNSLLELLVTGRNVGTRVLSYIKEKKISAPKQVGDISFAQFAHYMEADGKENIGLIRQEMREMMTEKVGVFRNERGVQDATESLVQFKKRVSEAGIGTKDLRMNQELLERWELDNLLETAMIIAKGALIRKESRGAHYREDYPERHDDLHFHNLASMTEYGKVAFAKRPINMSIYESKQENSEQFKIIPRRY
jgi:succinate dehydrogenase / fumarate reductase flavoprotein subunit